jgi:hypothetical protein
MGDWCKNDKTPKNKMRMERPTPPAPCTGGRPETCGRGVARVSSPAPSELVFNYRGSEMLPNITYNIK